jgi:hypothetical protein
LQRDLTHIRSVDRDGSRWIATWFALENPELTAAAHGEFVVKCSAAELETVKRRRIAA